MKIESVSPDSLELDERNARLHGKRNMAAITESLAKFGQRKPIVVWNNTVIAGNGTLQAARELGWKNIDITRVPDDWTEDKARAYALADNRSGDLADWDDSMLNELLTELEQSGWDRMDLGFEVPAAPVDPYAEWEDMPEYENTNMMPAARVIVSFLTLEDAEDFFKMLDRPRATSIWWPQEELEQRAFTKSHVFVNES